MRYNFRVTLSALLLAILVVIVGALVSARSRGTTDMQAEASFERPAKGHRLRRQWWPPQEAEPG